MVTAPDPRSRPTRAVRAGLTVLSILALAAASAPAPAVAAADLGVATAADAADMPAAHRLRITDLPLGGRGFVELEVERFDLVSPRLRYVRDGIEVPQPPFLHGMAAYQGFVAGEPGSSVALLRTGDGRFAGTIVHDGVFYEVTSEGAALLAAADMEASPALAGCRVERAPPGLTASPVLPPSKARRPRQPPQVQIPPGLFLAPVLLEGHYELWRRFVGDEARIVERLLAHFATVSSRLETDVAVRLQIAGIALRTRPDPPWSWAEFLQTHSVEEAPRAFVYMVNDGADRVDGGGSLAGLCTAYGPGDHDAGPPRDFGWSWPDTHTIAHEVGHVFGSDHTHCYGYSANLLIGSGLDPVLVRGVPGESPVDKCYANETGCYVGPIEPQGFRDSSIMSYCGSPSASYGAVGRYGVRSERVPQIMRATVERAAARYPGCLEVLTDAVGLHLASRDTGTATLAWNDVFTGEAAWLLETRAGRGWRTLRTLPPNSETVTLSRAQAKPGATYRLRVRIGGRVSEPSTVVALP